MTVEESHALSSIERKMKLMKTIDRRRIGSSARGLSSHHVPVEKSLNVRERAKGKRVIHTQRKRTEERVYLPRGTKGGRMRERGRR